MNLYSRYPANLSPSKASTEPPTSVTPDMAYRQVLSTSGTKKKRNPQLITKLSSKDESSAELRVNGIVDGCYQNNHSNLPQAKIKILLAPYTHLENAEINRVIRRINHFVILVFKQRAKLSDTQYLSLLKFFNITVPKVNGMLDHNAFKQRDFMHQANEKLLQKLYKVINSENGGIEPLIGKSNLNYFIGRGNNFYLVR